jgi:hypothetical protein
LGILLLPARRLRGNSTERTALRHGVAVLVPVRPLHVLPQGNIGGRAYCTGCAGPIEFGPVVRGLEAYCTIECSLGGDRPA